MDLLDYLNLPPRQRLDFLGIFGDDYGPKLHGHWVGGSYHAPYRYNHEPVETATEPKLTMSMDEISGFHPANPKLVRFGFRNALSVRACLQRLGVLTPVS